MNGVASEREVVAAVAALRAAGPALRATSWQDRARALGRVGERFLAAGDSLRLEVLRELPSSAGISAEQAQYVVEGMAHDWTAPRLDALVRTEFDDPDALDRWVDDPRAPDARRIRAYPLGSGLGLHVCAGTVPGVSVTSLVRGLLVASPVLLKPGAGDRTLPQAFLAGLAAAAELDPVARALAASCAVSYWPGGEGGEAESRALASAGYVVAYGHTATTAAIRGRLSAGTPMVEYGHKASVAVVGPQATESAPAAVARAVAAFDQRGCVCPHQVFVIDTLARARVFAGSLAGALEQLDQLMPPGPPDPGEAAAVQQLRGTTELRALGDERIELWAGPGVSWTVVLDPEPRERPSCLARTVQVTPLGSVHDLVPVLGDEARLLQTVGVTGLADAQEEVLAELVSGAGASRIVPVSAMPFPPPWWLHDGQGPLRSLVRWSARVPSGPRR